VIHGQCKIVPKVSCEAVFCFRVLPALSGFICAELYKNYRRAMRFATGICWGPAAVESGRLAFKVSLTVLRLILSNRWAVRENVWTCTANV